MNYFFEKKITFVTVSAFFLLLGQGKILGQLAIDQQVIRLTPFYSAEPADEFPKDSEPMAEEKIPGEVLFSANFSNSLGSWTKSGPNGDLWQHDDDGPNGQFAVTVNEVISSSSVNNGFAIFDADLSNPGFGPWQGRSGSLVSPSFSMFGVTHAFVEFYQKYRFCCDPTFFPKLEVSNNNFMTYATFDASIPNVGQGMVSPTHRTKVNISSFLDTATNLSAVKIRFTFQGNSQASHYYWQIDDIKVKEALEYDLNILSYKMGMGQMQLPYYFMPITQISPITFYGSVKNDGSMEGENVHLEVSLNQGGGSTSSDSIPLQPLDSASLMSYTLTPTPGTWNYYTVTYTFSQDSTEGYSIDNSGTEMLNVFDHLYSIDNNESSGYISNVSTQPGQPFKIGNVMEVLQDDIIDSMHVLITGTTSNIDRQVYGELRKRVNGAWQVIESTPPVLITWENYTQSIGLRFWNPVNVQAGDTLLVLACHVGGSADVRFKLAQSVDEGTVLGYTADGNLFTLQDPHAVMVRLNMNAIVGLTENSFDLLEAHPNPFTDELQITGFEKTGLLEIRDVQGRIVYSQRINPDYSNSINTIQWSPGMYTLCYQAEDQKLIKKVIKL
jgi:hypothetical protein